MSNLNATSQAVGANAWQRFWNRGGWWRAVLAAALYVGIYLGINVLLQPVLGPLINKDDPLGDPLSVFFGLAVPILIMGVLTFLFVVSLRWQREIFGRQPVKGRWWMWIAVVLVLIPNILHLVATNWSAYSVATVLSLLFVGLCVGFAEELITRGVAVNLLRRGGYTERLVFVLSSLIFGLIHLSNLVSGQDAATVGVTVLYAFGFGAMMYLSMRATGSIVWAMLLHASTDPSTILATGGIDTHGANAGAEGLILIGGAFSYVYVLFALIAIFLVKGKVFGDRSPRKRAVVSTEKEPSNV